MVHPAVACAALALCWAGVYGQKEFVPNQRIFGGEEARQGQPWMVSFTTPTGSAYCGGALIAPSWVLTAAHCPVATGHVALVGAGKVLGNTKDFNWRGVKAIIEHRAFNHQTLDNDILLVQLDQPVLIAQYMRLHDTQPPPPDNPTAPVPETTFKVIGWGLTEEGPNRLATTLREVTLFGISRPVCKALVQANTDPRRQLCAGGWEKDACKGDSGGPLFNAGMDPANGACQIGVVSFGPSCARTTGPQRRLRGGAYTLVPAYLQWIRDVIAKTEGPQAAAQVRTCRVASSNANYARSVSPAHAAPAPLQGPTGTTVAMRRLLAIGKWGRKSKGKAGKKNIWDEGLDSGAVVVAKEGMNEWDE